MNDLAPTVADLRKVQARLAQSTDAADRRVGHALATVLRGADAREALGLKAAPGRRSPLKVQRERDRNDLIRRLARAHFGHLAPALQAKAISDAHRRYEASIGRFDRFKDVMPAEYTGGPREILFQLARLGGPLPGVRRLIDILSQCSELGVFAASRSTDPAPDKETIYGR
ncbi:hypothetical protein EIK56_23095 [Sphingomonas sp. C8-2]|nr:hypothetical protein EIK56_23095 [Sphingomonas sp. C8-2]